mgnify:FL=1
MRIFKLVPLACAALMMGACASENEGNGGNTNESANEQYLAVNIMNVGTTPTRTAPGTYEDGTTNESKIELIRFYFYNADGTPYIMKNSPGTTAAGTKANWLQATTSKDGEDKPNTIEQITKSILVIDGETAAAPAKVVAIVNPGTLTTTTLGNGSVTLADLRSTLEDTQFNKNKGASAVEFVMSNSVYEKDAASVCETSISGHVTNSSTTAEANPVNIYVERVVAKVKANLNTTTTTAEPFKLGDGTNWEATKYGIKVGTYNSTTDVYAVIDGWGVADENGTAKLEKQIDPTWTDTSLGITTWSTSDYKRSFWETSVAFTGTNKLVNHKFTDYTSNAINTTTSYLYTLPNTPTAAITSTNKYDNDLTKFLVVAHLKYQDGATWKNAEICHYKGIDYLGVENLKTQIANECGVYVQSATTPVTYTKITKADITFTKSASAKDYQVVPKLVDDSKTYYVNTGTISAPVYTTKTAADINTEFDKSPAQVRTEGKVYYFIPIKHLGNANTLAEYGIVRNHLYNITLDKIVGFGTPVYDPDQIIDPTVPVDENTYLAARINVLQWRVVKQNVDLDYSK